MRCALVAMLLLVGPALVRAQDTAIVINPDSAQRMGGLAIEPGELPHNVAAQAVRFFNAPTTTRFVGRASLPRGNEWRGDVAVRNGSVTLAGRLDGSLLVINGDATFDSTAEVTGNVTLLGGTVTRAEGVRIGGEVHVYREPLAYRTSGDDIVLTPGGRRRLPFLGARKSWTGVEARSTLTIATAGTFNRVEGLPIVLGPDFDWGLRRGVRLHLSALGVARSVGDVGDTPGNLGYLVRTELRSGEGRGVGAGFRAYSVVAPIERRGLRDAEVGWAGFLFQRDYRDYYFAHGIAGRVFARPALPLNISLELARDREANVDAHDPWTVFRNSDPWRSNPPIDAGHFTTLGGAIALDTRNDREQPTSGWLIHLDIKGSWSSDVSPQSLPVAIRPPIPVDGSYSFSRAFLDIRRYTRVSASGRVNLRLLAGGWLGGDPLPLQQRLSIGGPDPLSGYGFRQSGCNSDLTDPAFVRSGLAACDRVLLTQFEYRGHLSLHWAYGSARPEDEQAKSLLSLQGPDLVVFGDAGQAWLVGNGPGRVPSDRLPTIGSWLGDLGLGMDWGGFGLYFAKAVTTGEPVRITVRLDHRF